MIHWNPYKLIEDIYFLDDYHIYFIECGKRGEKSVFFTSVYNTIARVKIYIFTSRDEIY